MLFFSFSMLKQPHLSQAHQGGDVKSKQGICQMNLMKWILFFSLSQMRLLICMYVFCYEIQSSISKYPLGSEGEFPLKMGLKMGHNFCQIWGSFRKHDLA